MQIEYWVRNADTKKVLKGIRSNEFAVFSWGLDDEQGAGPTYEELDDVIIHTQERGLLTRIIISCHFDEPMNWMSPADLWDNLQVPTFDPSTTPTKELKGEASSFSIAQDLTVLDVVARAREAVEYYNEPDGDIIDWDRLDPLMEALSEALMMNERANAGKGPRWGGGL